MSSPTQVVLRGRVVTPRDVLPDGVVLVDGTRLTWVGPVEAAPAGTQVPHRSSTTLLPGLVDLHCHGGGGFGFPEALDADEAMVAVAEHRRHGTTTLVASLVTADVDTLLARTATLAELAESGEIDGIHLEGPFLAARRCGAQDPAHLIPASAALVRRLATAARGHLRTMTLAPEVAGVLGPAGALRAVVEAGALPSIGHTDASAEVTAYALTEALTALARSPARSAVPTVTHLFNGMPAMHHRAPGPVAAALTAARRGEAVVELVPDGVHVAPATVRMVLELVGAHHVALVSDAIAATGMPDGTYPLGPVDVVVHDGVATVAATSTVAGSTAHLLDALRWTVEAGVPLLTATRAAATTPARVLGRDDVGSLEAGRRADLVEVDEDLRPLRVMRAGAWVS